MFRTFGFLLAVAVGAAAAAGPPDAGTIGRVSGLTPETKDGVVKIMAPRTDLSVVVDGVRMAPFEGLTSWAAFQTAGRETMVMGDITLAEDEVGAAMSAALDGGLAVTALHEHFAFDHPRILFMHLDGMGTTERLATGVAKVLEAVRVVRARAATPADSFGGPAIPLPSTIDAAPLERILAAEAQTKDGMAKFVFAQTTVMHGVPLGADMGVNTWAAFAGSPDAAVVDGDFAMRESELQGVLKALRGAGMQVVAIHGHMVGEQPRIMFLHYWGKGRAENLARAVKTALATQAR
jgi:uncharacterized protein DUF1259